MRVVLISEYKQRTSRPSSPIVNDELTVWITGHSRRKRQCYRWENERQISALPTLNAGFAASCVRVERRLADLAAIKPQTDSTCAESAQVSD
jgi:hypothetical protein